MKKIALFMSFVIMLMSLTACGHEHKWKNATCTEPKTCKDCGKTEGESRGHNWNEATCTEPEHCSECGEVKEGTEKGHAYQDGYCTRCKEKDPSYTPLSEYGFVNNNGMNAWICITGYDYQKKEVYVDNHPSYYYFGEAFVFEPYYFFSFSYTKYDHGNHINDQVISNGKFNTSVINRTTYSCNSIRNDYIDFVDDNYRSNLQIIERKVLGKYVVIKVDFGTSGMDVRHLWFVPADMLDLSTLSLHENEREIDDWGGKTDVLHIKFKD